MFEWLLEVGAVPDQSIRGLATMNLSGYWKIHNAIKHHKAGQAIMNLSGYWKMYGRLAAATKG